MHRLLRAPLLMLLAGVSIAAAQTSDVDRRDRRIRVRYDCGLSPPHATACDVTGWLRAVTDTTLRITASSAERDLIITQNSIRRLWVVDGTRSYSLLGAGIGLVAGAGIGAAIGASGDVCMSTLNTSCTSGWSVGLLIGAPAGMVLGAIIGKRFHSERWRPIVPPVIPAGNKRASGGLRVGVTVGF